jgi:hypothetical protein
VQPQTKSFLRQLAVYAILYYGLVLGLDALIFFVSHLPLKGRFDPLILVLGNVARFMVLPKSLLRHLWPSESTPTLFNYLLPLLNCAFWVSVFLAIKKLRTKVSG